ncbi:gdp-fucose transporter [Cystoisospora suis]|uniref:Gdp-fucose transporter n=1 Tax=Cystoisospora suis TaxID=483139 RepID=A0A2C6L9Y3_9APIC|nr:gdp-fucose transporter [Cystoisospora suis]
MTPASSSSSPCSSSPSAEPPPSSSSNPHRRLQFSLKSSASSVCLSSSPDGSGLRISKSTVCCICACLVYSVASLATVFLNRKLLTDLFPYPLTLSCFQEIVGVFVYLILSSVGTAAATASASLSHYPSSSPLSRELDVEEEDNKENPCSSSFCSSSSSSSPLSAAFFRKKREEKREILQKQPSSLLRRTLTASLRSPAACSLSTFFPHVELSVRILRRVLPLSLAFVGMVGFSNTCLKHVQVSTYQVARALTLLFNMLLQRLLLNIRISLGAGLSCGVVCLGFIIGALDESTLSLSGALTGSVASLFQAVYTVHIRSTLDALGGVQAAAMFYNMVNASLLFPPLIWLSGEFSQMSSSLFSSSSSSSFSRTHLLSTSGELRESPMNVGGDVFKSASDLIHGMPEVTSTDSSLSSSSFSVENTSNIVMEWMERLLSYACNFVYWITRSGIEGGEDARPSFFLILFLAFLSGVAALLLTLSSFWIVGLTSPLTFNVLGYVKACVQTSLGFVVFHEKCSLQALLGVILTLSGSASFSAFKRRDACQEEKDRDFKQKKDDSNKILPCDLQKQER